jgi:hypothetical protein
MNFSKLISKTKKKSSNYKNKKSYIKFLTTLVIVFFLIPYFFISVSSVSLLISTSIIQKHKAKKVFIKTSHVTSGIGRKYSYYFDDIPILGYVFKSSAKLSEIMDYTSSAQLSALNIKDYTKDLLIGLSKNKNNETQKTLDKLAAEYESLYQNTSFLQSHISEIPNLIQTIMVPEGFMNSLLEMKKEALDKKVLTRNLNYILSSKETKKYLFILMDDEILRGAGGVVDAIAIISVDNGKISDFEVFDTNDTKKNIVGYVQPPIPLDDILKNGWDFENVAWDPDFYYTAQKAEWFLDKQFDTSVNGVISITTRYLSKLNVQVLKNQIGNQLPDVNKDKQDYKKELSTWLKAVLDNAEDNNLLDYFDEGLLTKDIQFFSQQKNLQGSLEELNWAGMLNTEWEKCIGNCYRDYLMVVEDSLVKEPVSDEVSKSSQLKIFFEEKVIKHELAVLIDNKSDSKYEAYIRIVTPPSAGFGKVAIVEGRNKSERELEVVGIHGKKEAGTKIEVEPKEKKVLVLNWDEKSDLDFDKAGDYGLYWQKQAGSIDKNVSIIYSVPKNLSIDKGKNEFFLTDEGEYGYNISLMRDNTSRIFWK